MRKGDSISPVSPLDYHLATYLPDDDDEVTAVMLDVLWVVVWACCIHQPCNHLGPLTEGLPEITELVM